LLLPLLRRRPPPSLQLRLLVPAPPLPTLLVADPAADGFAVVLAAARMTVAPMMTRMGECSHTGRQLPVSMTQWATRHHWPLFVATVIAAAVMEAAAMAAMAAAATKARLKMTPVTAGASRSRDRLAVRRGKRRGRRLGFAKLVPRRPRCNRPHAPMAHAPFLHRVPRSFPLAARA